MNKLSVVGSAETHPHILDPKAPLQSARAFASARYVGAGCRELHYQNGDFFGWKTSHYRALDDADVRAEVYHFLDTAKKMTKEGHAPFNPKRSSVDDVLDALRADCNLSRAHAAPCWLDEEVTDLAADDIIACSNGLYHLPSGTLLPHTPSFFTTNALTLGYSENAEAPIEWLTFLDSLWPGDSEAIATLQQIFGYLLTADTRQQKAFLLIGPKRSGKGTIARILTALLGQPNVAGPTLSGLGSNFGLEPLIGKRLAVVSDARLGGKTDPHVIIERILAITGEDYLSVDRKFKTAWHGKLDVRFLVISNELPRLTDSSGALASRFVVLTLRNSFFGLEDKNLTAKLMAELPGILNWAIAGRGDLLEHGRFKQPASSADAIEDLEDLGSPVGAFIRDKCVLHPAKTVSASALFEAWQAWCSQQGREKSGTAQSFGRDLRSAVAGLTITQPREADASHGRQRHYSGIGLI